MVALDGGGVLAGVLVSSRGAGLCGLAGVSRGPQRPIPRHRLIYGLQGVVALFWTWWRGQRLRAALFTKLSIVCLVPNFYWLVQMLRAGEYRVLQTGYYVWLAAFALLVAVGVLNVVSDRRTSRTPTDGTPA